jgi:membrane-bound lytic murein transglycosylase D
VLTDTVTVNYPVDLKLVSDLTAAPLDELMALNPSLLRLTTPPDTSFDLHLPAGGASLFTQRIAAIPEDKRNAWRYHRVAPQDTLATVAREYRVTVAELAAANQLGASDSIAGVDALVIPTQPSAAPSARALLYTVRRGETLVTISDRFGVSLSQLRRWNRISGIKVEAGRKLHVADPAGVTRVSRSRRGRASSASAEPGADAGADSRKAAQAKGSSAKSGAARTRKNSRVTAAKKTPAQRSGTAAHTKTSGTASTGKPHARKRAAGSKHPSSK